MPAIVQNICHRCVLQKRNLPIVRFFIFLYSFSSILDEVYAQRCISGSEAVWRPAFLVRSTAILQRDLPKPHYFTCRARGLTLTRRNKSQPPAQRVVCSQGITLSILAQDSSPLPFTSFRSQQQCNTGSQLNWLSSQIIYRRDFHIPSNLIYPELYRHFLVLEYIFLLSPH